MTPTYTTTVPPEAFSSLPTILMETIFVIGLVVSVSAYYQFQQVKSVVGLFS